MKKRDDINFDEFKDSLKEMLTHTEANIAQLRSELDAVCSDDEINDVEDLASLNIISKKDNTLLKQQQNELEDILHALRKIEDGSYGYCEESLDPIRVERLRVNPAARCKIDIDT